MVLKEYLNFNFQRKATENWLRHKRDQSDKVGFFGECTQMQLITSQNFNIQTCFSPFPWCFSWKCWFKGQNSLTLECQWLCLEMKILLQNWFQHILLKAVRTGMIKSAIAILDDECILRLQNDGHIYGSDSILMPHGKLEPDLHGWSDHARRPCAYIKNPQPLLITFITRIASKLIIVARKEFKQCGTDSILMPYGKLEPDLQGAVRLIRSFPASKC